MGETKQGERNMKNRGKHLRQKVLLACNFILPLTGGCDTGGKVSVNVHGVNYSEDDMSYAVTDPLNKDNSGGGELVGPYSAGGIMCCYSLPRRWKSGIEVRIDATIWTEVQENGKTASRKEKRQYVVEVPRYATGKPGDLWVIRHADGSMGVISSDYQPDHEKWPGEPKGWPEPSLEFQRKLWDQHIEIAEDNVRTAKELLRELAQQPEKASLDAWEHAQRNFREEAKQYKGPDDPEYRSALREKYSQFLERNEAKLKELKERRP